MTDASQIVSADAPDGAEALVAAALRVDHPGAFLRPDAVRRAHAAAGADQDPDHDDARAEIDAAIEAIAARQRDCGLSAPGDGDFRDPPPEAEAPAEGPAEARWRRRLAGFDAQGRLVAPLDRSEAAFARDAAQLRAAAGPDATLALPNPDAVARRIASAEPDIGAPWREIYGEPEALAAALRALLAQELDACVAAGQRRVRLLAREGPAEATAFAAALSRAHPAGAVDLVLRLALDAGAHQDAALWEAVAAAADAAPNLSLVVAPPPDADLGEAPFLNAFADAPQPPRVMLGLLDARRRAPDAADVVLCRLDQAGRRYDADRMGLAHDGDFEPAPPDAAEPLREDDQWRKLDRLVAIAERAF